MSESGPREYESNLTPDLNRELELEFSVESIANKKHPENNEDAYFADKQRGIFAVFDGMGGAVHGEEASARSRDVLAEHIAEFDPVNANREKAEDFIRRVFGLMHADVKIAAHKDIAKTGMGTTALVSLIWREGSALKLSVGNVGDSRCYLLRNGKLALLTIDQSQMLPGANDQEKRSYIEKLDELGDLSETNDILLQTYYRFRAVIDQAIGIDSIKPEVLTVDLQPGDRLVLCTDGVSDNLKRSKLAQLLAEENAQAGDLVASAKAVSEDPDDKRHKPDDMTALVVEVK